MAERLQKLLARAGVASRRAAEGLILAGRVSVDGRIVRELGVRVSADARILVNGREIHAESPVYVLMNKPAGFVCTLFDPQGRPLVTELTADIAERVFPVGRLDVDTEGALILTNDGAFAHRILHPSREIPRTYEALVRGLPNREALARLTGGVLLEDGPTHPARVRVLRREAGQALVEIVIHEGRKRQVRRMLRAVGHPVLHLRRVAYGGLRLGKLPLGQYRRLGPADLERIFL